MMTDGKTKSTQTSTFDRKIILQALLDSLKKLNPKTLIRNPVMFVVEVVAIISTYVVLREIVTGRESLFNIQITFWLWITVFFANFAEAIAEGRGKAQAEALRKARSETMARKVEDGKEIQVNALDLRKDDIVVCEAGDVIPVDGVVV